MTLKPKIRAKIVAECLEIQRDAKTLRRTACADQLDAIYTLNRNVERLAAALEAALSPSAEVPNNPETSEGEGCDPEIP